MRAYKPLVDIDTLKRRLDYDPKTGLIMWLVAPANNYVRGWYPGSLTVQGYYNVSIFAKLYRVHRVAWAIYYSAWPTNQVDHDDGDRANNRIANLKDVPPVGNARNAKLRTDNTIGVAGVIWNNKNNNYNVQIGVNGRNKFIGAFDNVEDAIAARQAAEVEYGYHSRHGKR